MQSTSKFPLRGGTKVLVTFGNEGTTNFSASKIRISAFFDSEHYIEALREYLEQKLKTMWMK